MILSRARKFQIIADAVTGKETAAIDPGSLGEPWSIYYAWICQWIDEDPQQVDAADLMHDFYQQFVAMGGDEELQNYHLIQAAIHAPIAYPPASEMVKDLPDLAWLWPGWLPSGLVSLLAATPGTGKSYLALDLAQRVISGTQFPNGSPVLTPGPVVYVDAENTPSIFKKRVQIWSPQTLAQVYVMLPDPRRLVINLDEAEDRERLWDMCWSIRPALVILDSYSSATLRGENKKEDVQQVLAFLSRLAKDARLALLIVHHLRKRNEPPSSFLPTTIDAIRGSSYIPAMARNVLGLQWVATGPDPDENKNGPRRLWVMKSNIGRYPPPLGVTFTPHPRHPDVAVIGYGAAPVPYRAPNKSDDCADWLEELLRNAAEPMRPKEICELGKREGYNKRMLLRVRKRLDDRIQDTEERFHPNNRWEWAGE